MQLAELICAASCPTTIVVRIIPTPVARKILSTHCGSPRTDAPSIDDPIKLMTVMTRTLRYWRPIMNRSMLSPLWTMDALSSVLGCVSAYFCLSMDWRPTSAPCPPSIMASHTMRNQKTTIAPPGCMFNSFVPTVWPVKIAAWTMTRHMIRSIEEYKYFSDSRTVVIMERDCASWYSSVSLFGSPLELKISSSISQSAGNLGRSIGNLTWCSDISSYSASLSSSKVGVAYLRLSWSTTIDVDELLSSCSVIFLGFAGEVI